MPEVSIIHTEINPDLYKGSGGGRRSFVDTEVTPEHAEGAGGGRRIFTVGEFPPIPALPLPDIITGPATGIGLLEAIINGFLEGDGGMSCSCAFEWGPTDGYGNVTMIQDKTAGERFSEVLIGLEPDTLYHFRAIAYNVFGLSRGADRIFRTLNEVEPSYFQGPFALLLEDET